MTHTEKKPLLLFLSIGVMQGLLYTLLLASPFTKAFSHVLAPSLIFIVCMGFITLFSYNGKQTARLLLFTFFLSILISLIVYFTPFDRGVTTALTQIFGIYTAICLLQGYHHNQYQKPEYSTLFANVWNNISLLFTTAVFVLLSKLVFLLWGALFSLIGIKIFSHLFSSLSFYTLFTPIFSVIGLYISFKSKHLIYGLRAIILGFFKALLPVLSFIGTLYLVALIVKALTNLHPIAKEATDIGLQSLTYVFLAIIFINAVYQDGKIQLPQSRWYRITVATLIYLLPLMSFLSLITLFICSPQPSLNKTSINLFLALLLFLGYASFYLVGILQKKRVWLSTLKTGNTILAWVLIGLMILFTIPSFYQLFPNPPKRQIASKVTAKNKEILTISTDFLFSQSMMYKARLSWIDSPKASSSLILGYRDNRPLHTCQVSDHGTFFFGEQQNNQCAYVLTLNDGTKPTAHFSPTFQSLQGKTAAIRWQNGSAMASHGKTLIQSKLKRRLRHLICRTIYDGKIHLGSVTAKVLWRENSCQIIVNNQVHGLNFFEELGNAP